MTFRFDIAARDGLARAGRVETSHGCYDTPAFMPVATQGAVKGLTSAQVRDTDARIILCNAYHLALRPGDALIARLGGIHKFMGWDGPILTDSGGYQVFSLAAIRKITDEGVLFRSHVDGSEVFITPERASEIQLSIGADIIMAFDECPPPTAPREVVLAAVERTISWARRCRAAVPVGRAALFGIVQGGVYPDLREQCAVALKQMGFEGYGVGGLGIGETTEQMMEMTSSVTELLDDDRPRYLMGLGKPTDIVGAIGRGVDMFDCVVPTRNARNAMLFSDSGPMRMRNAAYADDPRPPVEGCGCPTCRNHSRAYLRHLYNSGEHLAGVLGTIHNIYYYQSLVRRCREAIIGGRFSRFSDEYLSRYSPEHEDSE